ncbi:MAG: caspase family protein [Leptolyngbyaceae cyanobacterium bins.349]|nr:caspase family protein [Leptolyngbyaceae cyanobacterium bins.349]
MGLTRRNFLRQTGITLAAWGVSGVGLWQWSDRDQQVLAAPTTRKLALLVGINQYPFNPGLEGCITDVELQRELLIQRFGFQPTDIVSLTDWQATREAVETAFVEHLIQQAKAGDVVVFHFSGFGSTLAGDSPGTPRTSLVMADAAPTGETPQVNDLLMDTLGLLLRSLKTDHVTTVLDTSYLYLGQPLQGNLRVRSYPNPSTAQPADAELAFQSTLLHQLNLNSAPAGSGSSWPGILLTAAASDQVATEVHGNRFHAGLLTSTFTQALWQATPPMTLRVILHQVAQRMESLVSQQQPQLGGQHLTRKQQDRQLAPYFLLPSTVESVGAILSLEEGDTLANVWLGGLPASLLESYGVNSLLTVVPRSTGDRGPTSTLQIIARDGLTAKAKVCCQADADAGSTSSLQVGQQVQEAVRVLPRNIGLTVALDGSLERIERVDAISAFTAVPRVSSAIAGEQAADFLFSKVQTQLTQLAALPTAPVNRLVASSAIVSYGLFSLGRDVILSTTGEGGEAVKVAVRRLVPKLQTLLATKLLNLTVNHQTSQLSLAVQLEQITGQEQVLARQTTNRMATSLLLGSKTFTGQGTDGVQVPVGSRIRYQVNNAGREPLYALAIALDSVSNLQWVHVPTLELETSTAENPATAPTIAPQASVIFPTAVAGSEWQIQGSTGLGETYLVLSRSPFNQTIATLVNQQRSGSSAIAGAVLTNPLEIVQAILQDLHQPSALPALANSADVYALDVNTWATFRFTYQVI